MLSVLLISGHNVTPYLYDANVISAKEAASMHQITNFSRIFQGASIDQYFLHFPFCWLNLTLPHFAIGLFLTHDSFPAPNGEKKKKRFGSLQLLRCAAVIAFDWERKWKRKSGFETSSMRRMTETDCASTTGNYSAKIHFSWTRCRF